MNTPNIYILRALLNFIVNNINDNFYFLNFNKFLLFLLRILLIISLFYMIISLLLLIISLPSYVKLILIIYSRYCNFYANILEYIKYNSGPCFRPAINGRVRIINSWEKTFSSILKRPSHDCEKSSWSSGRALRAGAKRLSNAKEMKLKSYESCAKEREKKKRWFNSSIYGDCISRHG